MMEIETLFRDAALRYRAGASGWETTEVPGAAGKAFTLYARLRDREGQWNAPLLRQEGRDGQLVWELVGQADEDEPALTFSLATDWNPNPLRVRVAAARIGVGEWRDLVVRYSGANLELFVDGALVDEEWPIGTPSPAEAAPQLLGGEIARAAIWRRPLSDAEIETLYGGAADCRRRADAILGEERPVRQFWQPRGLNTFVGDCMPFFHDGRFHLFYLLDRRHHRSKWGLGAHQWAHASTTDLVHWEQHPLAIPITEEWEGSICTGSLFFHEGCYYGFYATRTVDGSAAPLCAAVSRDGVHFEKLPPLGTLHAPYQPAPARDPVVFQDPANGVFHMLVTTELAEYPALGRGGCLAHLVSTDLRHWEQRDPFLVPGDNDQPECADFFFWRGWYYLIFSNHGVAHYRMARTPYGPWLRPRSDDFDGPQARVMKTAAFTGDRRIGAAFLAENGYAGQVLFRELVQHADGTLGTCFPAELLPTAGAPLELTFQPLTAGASGDGKQARLSAPEGFAMARLAGMPHNARLTLRVEPEDGSAAFGVCLRDQCDGRSGQMLLLEPPRAKVGVRPAGSDPLVEFEQSALYAVDGLDRPLTLEIILQDDIMDVCVDQRRTLICRVPETAGDCLCLFVRDGAARFRDIAVQPLRS